MWESDSVDTSPVLCDLATTYTRIWFVLSAALRRKLEKEDVAAQSNAALHEVGVHTSYIRARARDKERLDRTNVRQRQL